MCEGFGRVLEPVERLPKLTKRQGPLAADQIGSGDGRQNHNRQRRPKADDAANLDKQGDLDQRNPKKDQKQWHRVLT